jgi:hypothetical protein
MAELKLVLENPSSESLGGSKCRLEALRFSNGGIRLSVKDFEVSTQNVEEMKKGLENFKDFQIHVLELEQALNIKQKETEKQ